MTTRSNKWQRETVAKIRQNNDDFGIDREALFSVAASGLITFNPDGSVEVTPEGREAVKQGEAMKAKRNASARKYYSVTRSCGLRKTAGGWE